MDVHTKLKFVTLPVPEIIWGTEKICAVPGYAHAPFSPKFLMDFHSDGPDECKGQSSNLKSVALHVPEIIAIEALGGNCEPPILGKTRQ